MLKEIVKKLVDSFDTAKGGFSVRKLSTFASIVIAAYFGFRFGDENNIVELTIIWLSFALLCLGIVTFEQIIKLKNDRQINSRENTEITPSTN